MIGALPRPKSPLACLAGLSPVGVGDWKIMMSQDIITKITTDTKALCKALARLGSEPTPPGLFKALADTSLLGIAPRLRESPDLAFRTMFEVLRAIGRVRLPLAVGLTMHQYIVATIATVPLSEPAREQRRADLLDAIVRGHHLCAVSSFDYTVAPDGAVNSSVTATRLGDKWSVRGAKRFQSLASKASLLFFSAAVDGKELALFYAAVKDEPAVRVGDLVGDGFMAAADTRSVVFENLVLTDAHLLSGGTAAESGRLHDFSRAWFQALVPAAYLGAAEAALMLAQRECGTRHRAGEASIDVRFQRELGRLRLQVEQGLQLSHAVEAALRGLANRDGATGGEPAGRGPRDALREFAASAQVLKYFGTRAAREVTEGAGEILGLKGMLAPHPFSTLAQAAPFAVLHPKTNAEFELAFGDPFLSPTAI